MNSKNIIISQYLWYLKTFLPKIGWTLKYLLYENKKNIRKLQQIWSYKLY